MATESVFGGRTVWTSDIDVGACRIIAHRYPDAPNLGDITKIDWAGVEPIDLLDAGWPCQPFSHAGKRLGAADERALWPEVARAVRALRPRHVVLENVAAIASAGELARACADLAALGYVGSWRCLRAADVGAPHGRARIFIVATDTGGLGQQRGAGGVGAGRHPAVRVKAGDHPGDGDSTATDAQRGGRNGRAGQLGPRRRAEPAHSGNGTAAYATGDGWHEGGAESARIVGRLDVAQRGATVADPDSGGRQGVGVAESAGVESAPWCEPDRRRDQWGQYAPAVQGWERILERPAPAPTEASPRGTQRLSPAFVEWMMGLPAGWVTDVPGLGRNAQLKALGNGVVPQQAAAAIRMMSDHRPAVSRPLTG